MKNTGKSDNYEQGRIEGLKAALAIIKKYAVHSEAIREIEKEIGL